MSRCEHPPPFNVADIRSRSKLTRAATHGRHDEAGLVGTPGSAGAVAGPSLHPDWPLPSGNTAGLAVAALPAPAAHDGRPVHSSVVHPPISTAKLSARATPPHVPCRRGRRRSQEGHHHEPHRFPTSAASGLGARQEPTRSFRANRHPRKDTTTNHVASRLPPHRAWGTSKNPHDPSGQIGTPGSAGALAGPSLHSGQPLPSGNTPNCPRAPQPNRRPRLGETLINGTTTVRTPTLQTPAPYCIVYG